MTTPFPHANALQDVRVLMQSLLTRRDVADRWALVQDQIACAAGWEERILLLRSICAHRPTPSGPALRSYKVPGCASDLVVEFRTNPTFNIFVRSTSAIVCGSATVLAIVFSGEMNPADTISPRETAKLVGRILNVSAHRASALERLSGIIEIELAAHHPRKMPIDSVT